jgi:hypothetical protein
MKCNYIITVFFINYDLFIAGKIQAFNILDVFAVMGLMMLKSSNNSRIFFYTTLHTARQNSVKQLDDKSSTFRVPIKK